MGNVEVGKHHKNLRVAVVSKSNADGGGASKVAEDLAILLNTQANVVAHHWIGYRGSVYHPHMRSLFGGPWFSTFHKACRLISRTVGLPDFLTPEIFHLWFRKKVDYDIYHFHDTSTTFSPLSMRWLAKRKPVVWTIHDCSPFTGGCLYPMECTAFHIRCQRCPQLGIWPLLSRWDMTGIMQSYKRTTARKGLFVPISPSQWMADEAVKSGMFSQRPRTIPYSVDVDFYRPVERQTVRKTFGLDPQAFTVLVSAWRLTDRRKGTEYALSALQSCDRPISVVVAGRYNGRMQEMFSGLNTHFAGFIKDPNLMARYYAAADVFLFPTLADNLPNSVLESMASGTPTIGFRTGGLPDMVEHGVSGWLAELKDVEGLVEGLRTSFDRREIVRRWGNESRNRAEKIFSRQSFLESHLELYAEILEGKYPGLGYLARFRDEPKV